MHVVPINCGINPPNRSTPHRDTAHRHNFRTMGNMSTNDPNITGIHHQMHMNECTHIPYLKTSPSRCTTSSHHNSPFSSPNKYVHAAQSFNYSHIFTSNISFNHHRHIITTIMIIVITNLSPHQHIVTFKTYAHNVAFNHTCPRITYNHRINNNNGSFHHPTKTLSCLHN